MATIEPIKTVIPSSSPSPKPKKSEDVSLKEKQDAITSQPPGRAYHLEQIKQSLPDLSPKFRKVIEFRKKLGIESVWLAFCLGIYVLGPVFGQMLVGWIIISVGCVWNYYLYRSPSTLLAHEVLLLYENQLRQSPPITSRRPWHEEKFLIGILIGVLTLGGNCLWLWLYQEGDYSIRMSAISIGCSAGTLLVTCAHVEAQVVETLEERIVHEESKFLADP